MAKYTKADLEKQIVKLERQKKDLVRAGEMLKDLLSPLISEKKKDYANIANVGDIQTYETATAILFSIDNPLLSKKYEKQGS